METVWSRAAEVINNRGWVQGAFMDIYGSVCLIGGIGVVVEDDNEYERCHDKLRSHLGGSVISWNDNPERTKRQVVEVLQELHEKELAERVEL